MFRAISKTSLLYKTCMILWVIFMILGFAINKNFFLVALGFCVIALFNAGFKK